MLDQRLNIWKYIVPFDSSKIDHPLSNILNVKLLYISQELKRIDSANLTFYDYLCVISNKKVNYNDKHWDTIASYYILPNSDEPRFLLDCNRKILLKSITSIYSPGTKIGTLKLYIIKCLAILKLLDKIFKCKINVYKKPQIDSEGASFLKYLGEDYYKQPVSFSVHLGSRPRQVVKYTGLYCDVNGSVLGYFKFSDSNIGNQLIQNEINILTTNEWLNTNNLVVPKIKYVHNTSELSYFIMSPLKARLKVINKFTKYHYEFIYNIYMKTKNEVKWERSNIYSDLLSNISQVSKIIFKDYIDFLSNTFSLIDKHFHNRNIIETLAHRDFVPWNTKSDGKRLYIFDWEYATDSTIPLWDYFNYYMHCTNKQSYFPSIKSELAKIGKLDDIYSELKKDLYYYYIIYCIDYISLFSKEGQEQQMKWLNEINHFVEHMGQCK